MYNQNLHFHFTGIGGSGMSGLAEILLNLGFKVSGSDLRPSSVSDRLVGLGATVEFGHAAEYLPAAASLLVYSSAVKGENPELREAARRGIPVVRRAEVLAELMRLKFGVAVAGSHGKTTTTSMIAAVLERGGLDPTVIIGGVVRATGTGAKVGKSTFLVAESDESDRSFLLLKPTIAVVTNIDSEHLSAYASLQELEESFESFVKAVPFYGLAALCLDDPRLRALAQRLTRRCVTYGLSPDAQIRVTEIAHVDRGMRGRVFSGSAELGTVELPMLGRHMLVNSLAAVAVGLEFGIPFEKIRDALANFSGVQRRLEIVGTVGGVTVMNDYGHHPTEIRATLRAIREGWGTELGRLHVIFQPHRYSRTKECFAEFVEAFADADRLVVSEIYAAGEEALEGIGGKVLCDAIAHSERSFVPAPVDALPALLEALRPGDVVLCLGAGSVGQLPETILGALKLAGFGSVRPREGLEGALPSASVSSTPVANALAELPLGVALP